MSKKGLKKVANIMSNMQETRHKLLQSATVLGKKDVQDIRLAQLLEVGLDAMKITFTKITLNKW